MAAYNVRTPIYNREFLHLVWTVDKEGLGAALTAWSCLKGSAAETANGPLMSHTPDAGVREFVLKRVARFTT